MPREKIAVTLTHDGPGKTKSNILQVSWMPGNVRGWAQISIAPAGWQDTSEWEIVDLDEDSIGHLIRVLKRVRRKSFPHC